MTSKSARTAEFGDFQTPRSLATAVCATLVRKQIAPLSIIEPTCGEGAFLVAALAAFPGVHKALGVEIRASYAATSRRAIQEHNWTEKAGVLVDDFFALDWKSLIATFPPPLLIIGNPPWVTNSAVGALQGSNLPAKSNFQGHSGLDAKTGKSNFDISEWMLIRLLETIGRREAVLAMLCKTTVARKVLSHAWKSNLGVEDASIHRIDSEQTFGVSVDACLLVCQVGGRTGAPKCRVFASIDETRPLPTIGLLNHRLVADVDRFRRVQHLFGTSPYRWRSGVKHDCRSVMDLVLEGGFYRNAMGELVELEDTHLYPTLKGGDVAKGNVETPRRWMVVPQTRVGQETASMRHLAPRTWQYLVSHGDQLDRRASSIYRKQPRFAIFGVGDYSFAPWKVAVSGLHKRLSFAVVGSYAGKPILLDDTCYFVPCRSRDEAEFLAALLTSDAANDYFDSLIFWESKRPITADVLRTLDLGRLAADLGVGDAFAAFQADHNVLSPSAVQKHLFELR
jgi:hypothetical protein